MPEIKVKQIDFFDDRWYRLDISNKGVLETRWLSSITQKLGILDKPYLAKWRGDVGNREADLRVFEASERGTRIHHAFNVLVNGGQIIYNPWNRPNYTDEELAAIKTLHVVVKYQDEFYQVLKLYNWLKIVKPKILFSEQTVYSLTNNDAGTLDLAVHIEYGKYLVNGAKPLEIPEGNYICDLKSGNQVSDEAYLQTAAYLKCAEEMGLETFDGTIILHTGSRNKSGIEGLGTLLRLTPQVEDDYKNYRLASDLWLWKHKDDQPRVFQMPTMISLIEK
jgi:hypothetical protein